MSLRAHPFLIAVAFLAAAPCYTSTAVAAVIWTDSWEVGAEIPDDDPVGYSDTRTASFDPGLVISHVTVTLFISGGWSGDLYAYLTNGSGFSVLLNRPGRDAGVEDGASASTITLTFSDDAALDLHALVDVQATSVVGTWQPDARNVSPYSVVTSDDRTAFLSSFIGQDPTMDFTLFVADVSAGETSTLEAWGLEVTAVSAIPEPGSHLLMAILLAGGLALRRRADL